MSETELDLSDQELDRIPDYVFEGRNPETLEYLDLSKNKLPAVPAAIGDLGNLEFLNLSGNQLEDVPPEFGNLSNLQYLNLGFNQLQTLPAAIGDLSNLKTLYLHRNPLKGLPYTMGNLTKLECLSVYDTIEYFPESMLGLKNLRKIYFCNSVGKLTYAGGLTLKRLSDDQKLAEFQKMDIKILTEEEIQEKYPTEQSSADQAQRKPPLAGTTSSPTP